MVKINKIYTRMGDAGDTQLVGGTPTRKDSLRVAAYGEVDELNSILGMVRTHASADDHKQTADRIGLIQNELFDLGAELATQPGQEWEGMVKVTNDQVTRLEKWIDEITADLPELRSFVLPGGSSTNAFLHLARAVCRRAERSIVALSLAEHVAPTAIAYVNRLSDFLFALARFEAHASGAEEYLWEPGKKAD